MGKYKYEKFKAKAGSKEYIFSQHNGDEWIGPAIDHLCKDNTTIIGNLIGQKKFSFEIDIQNPEGTEYVIKENNKEGYPNGPVIVAINDSLYFGPYYAKRGFNGIVYKIKKGEKIHIQEYKYGVLVDECLDDTIIYEDVVKNLSFDSWFEIEPDEFVERKISNKKAKGIEYIAGDPTGHLQLCGAFVDEDNNVIIGQYKNNAFNGISLVYNQKFNVSTLQFFESGEPLKDYRLLYSKEFGFSLIIKDSQINDGKTEYISIVYGKDVKGCKLEIRFLDNKENIIGNPIVLPNYIDPNAEKPYGPSIQKHLPKKDENGLTARDRLNNLIGLNNVKKELDKLQAILKKNPDNSVNMNMCFYGNPGTGKTEVARLLAEILYDEGLLKENKLIETDPSGLIGEYVGQTQPKTHKKFKEALNGVLFIDEAYNLNTGTHMGGGSFGQEAIGALLEDMENYRGQICVILAGYRKPMEDMIALNPGFESRINRKIDFPDYTRGELEKITELVINKMKYSTDNTVIKEIAKLVESRKFLDGYANARDVRTIVEKLTEIQALRTIDEKSNRTITMDDIKLYNEKDSPEKEDGKTAEERLNELIGLDGVKVEIQKMFAILDKNKGDLGKTNLHMCFYGNPGTGKTEVANLIANIFYDKGILPTNKCIVTNASGLLAEYTGQTQIKTHKAVKDALNGVLFIDEAYSLKESSFGKEAVAALLEDMETYRGKFSVILAGYKNEIEELFALNPGFESRINRKIDFPDYTTNELLQIAQLMINKKKYIIDDDAKTELGKVLLTQKNTSKSNNKPFANAREVRNILESIYEIQALRTVKNSSDDYLIILDDVKEYEDDHNINPEITVDKVKKHEFKVSYEELQIISSKDYFNIDVDYIQKATVNIKVDGLEGSSEGSGFFISRNGLIGTCAHVVSNAEKITVIVNYKIENGEFITKDYAAEIVAINEYDDTAIIGILSKNINVDFYQLKAEAKGFPKLLTKILMGGFPLGASRFDNISLNEGTVQSINKDAFDDNENTWIYVDLNGLPGSSGSGVINKETGQLEGIFAGCSINPSNHSQTINRIIPVKYLWKLIYNYSNNSMSKNCTVINSVISKKDSINKNNAYHDSLIKNNSLEVEPYFDSYSNIRIVRGDVTSYKGDAIVNAANKYLAPGAGVCGAVFRGAGYKELEEACRLKGEQEVGSAVVTSGFSLPVNFIIHAVGPRYDVDRNPERLLSTVYKNCFDEAEKNDIKSIAFPSISTGIYHFPIELACPIALREMMKRSNKMKEIVVYCFDERTYNTYIETFRRLKGFNK